MNSTTHTVCLEVRIAFYSFKQFSTPFYFLMLSEDELTTYVYYFLYRSSFKKINKYGKFHLCCCCCWFFFVPKQTKLYNFSRCCERNERKKDVMKEKNVLKWLPSNQVSISSFVYSHHFFCSFLFTLFSISVYAKYWWCGGGDQTN